MLKRKNPDSKLIFVHIGKTGGTTLDQVLNREAMGRSFWLKGPAPAARERLRAMADEEKNAYRLFAGHLPFGLHEELPGPCEYVTLLRDPVERQVSHYYHVRGEPEHYLHEAVVGGGMSLLDYATSGVSKELDNLQTRMIAGIDWNERFAVGECPPELLGHAMRNLGGWFVAVGINERFDECLLLFKDLLGWRHEPYYESARVNRARPRYGSIPDDVRAAIVARNRLDVELYTRVRETIEAAIRGRGPGFGEAVEAFRVRNRQWAEQKQAERA